MLGGLIDVGWPPGAFVGLGSTFPGSGDVRPGIVTGPLRGQPPRTLARCRRG